MTRSKIIVNPIAHRGAGERAIPAISATLSRSGLEFDLVRSERRWHAAELAEQAAASGYSLVVAVGGDGTANEVLNGLMQAKLSGAGTAAMGIVSVGRGNDFAYGMGVPPGLDAGCQVLAQPHRRVIDVGRVVGGLYPAGRFFGNGVGIGFDTVVGFQAAKMRWLRGFASYLVAAIKTVYLYYKAPLVSVEYDGQIIKLPALMISVMNGRRMGGGFHIAPKAETDDGLFDLMLARQVSRGRVFTLMLHFLRGTQATQEPITTGRARHVVVTALEGVLPAHADGETLCTDGQRLEMELLPGQLEILSTRAGADPRLGKAKVG